MRNVTDNESIDIRHITGIIHDRLVILRGGKRVVKEEE